MTSGSAAISVEGNAFERGRAQARGTDVMLVRSVIERRVTAAASRMTSHEGRGYLRAQRAFAQQHCTESMQEVAGLADGFGMALETLFAFLHLGKLADVARHSTATAAGDGCSVWAVGGPEGALVGKNRDFHGEQADIQRLFLHGDPDWGDRRILCVGSLGAPGAYSSGINSDGLVVADTQVAATDHGPGWLRYFVMTRLLSRHASVVDALADIRSLQHTGGGTLVLGDAGGTVAAVELGHTRVHVETHERGSVARTNHFLSADTRFAEDSGTMRPSSEGRLERMQALFAHPPRLAATALQDVMSSHDSCDVVGLCRHGQDGDSRTLSSSVFDCAQRTLRYMSGNPCEGQWLSVAVGMGAEPEPAP